MTEISRKTKRYPSESTDEESERIAPLIPVVSKRGRKRPTRLREMINALRYMIRSGCGWEILPVHSGPRQTVYWWFRRLICRFLFQTIHDLSLIPDWEVAGRETSHSGGVMDSQSVKAPSANTSGYDAGKKVLGRKRHVADDTNGRLLAGDMSDSAGGQMILDGSRKRSPWVKHFFADGAHDRVQHTDKAAFLDFIIDVIKRSDSIESFQVLPRRWFVERTFDRMTRWRRLVRDYEQRIDASEAIIHITMASILLRRLAIREFPNDSCIGATNFK